jgi:hypothetical protein
MVDTLAPQPEPVSVGPDEGAAMPLVNPMTVSMAVALTFLVAVLAVVAARPTSAHDVQGADDRPPAAASPARMAGTPGSD